jgi:protein-S-isoprenylcysteine O-methyltransferase Ste14
VAPQGLSWIVLSTCWVAWAYPFAFRAPHAQKRESITVTGPTRVGLLLEAGAVFLAFFRTGPNRTGPATLAIALIFGVTGAVMAWTAVTHLGKQFRVHAGLYADHELVRTGPYAIVRHPIYASVLALLLTTVVLRNTWPRAVICLAVFVVGTEIRVRSEDTLLASRFGDKFREYKRGVPAYIPFVR